MNLSRGVGRYEIVVGRIIKPLLKSGGAPCYQTTKKWWGKCPQAHPMVTPLHINVKPILAAIRKFKIVTFNV